MSRTILHCIATLEGGGAEKQLCYLSKGLIEHGWDVHVLIIRRGVNYERMQNTGATIHQIRVKNNYDLKIICQIYSTIKNINADIVHCWQRPMDFFGSLAALFSGIPLVLAERTDPRRYSKSFKGRVRDLISQFASGIISNSESGQVYWRRRLIRNIPIDMIPNIIPLDEINSEKEGRYPALEYLVAVGRLSPEKNYVTLIEVFQKLFESNENFQLRILGTGPDHDYLEDIVSKKGLSKHVIFQGYTENVIPWVKNAKLYISLSLFEGMPNATLEAAATGTPMIISDIPAHRLYFDETSALIVNPQEPDELLAGLKRVLADYKQAINKGIKAREAVQNNDEATVSGQFVDFYEKILEKR